MGKCVIFGAAEFDSLIAPIRDTDLVIAADGGMKHLAKIHRNADVILGDFDSLGYVPGNATVFPVEKDDTDLMLAVRHGLNAGCRDFLLYGALDGKRIDHAIANFQTLAFLKSHGARGILVGKDHLATVVESETLRFPAGAEGILSVFCLGADARGVNIRGLQYSLENGTLTGDFPLGVSNHFVGKPGEISVTTGKLLLIWDSKIGLPEWE